MHMPEEANISTNPPAAAPSRKAAGGAGRGTGPRGETGKGGFDHRILSIRRVARVVAGGRRFSFSVALVMGDRKGMVGVGVGKGADTALAIDKAQHDAKRRMRKIALTKDSSIPHDVSAKYAASQVIITPAPGRGLIAGSSVRHVLEFAGVRNVSAKVLSRSKNQLNNARAALAALAQLRG